MCDFSIDSNKHTGEAPSFQRLTGPILFSLIECLLLEKEQKKIRSVWVGRAEENDERLVAN